MKGVINASAVRRAHGIVFTVALMRPVTPRPACSRTASPSGRRAGLQAMSLQGRPTRNIAAPVNPMHIAHPRRRRRLA